MCPFRLDVCCINSIAFLHYLLVTTSFFTLGENFTIRTYTTSLCVQCFVLHRALPHGQSHNGNSNNNNNDGINNSGNAIGKAALKILASLSNRKWETVANDGIYSIRQTYELMKSSYVAIGIVAELVIVLPKLNNRRKHQCPISLNRTSANGVDQQTYIDHRN